MFPDSDVHSLSEKNADMFTGMKGSVIGVLGCLACAAFVASCAGGGGSGTTTGGSLSCGPNYQTPNYVQDTDPGSGTQNFVLHWSGFPLNLYEVNQVTFTNGLVSVTSSDIIADAVSRWGVASSGGVSMVNYGFSLGAHISVEFVKLPAKPGSGSTLGTTTISYFTSNNQMVRADVKINYWDGMTLAEFNLGLRHTTTHEVGHALFLHGHSSVNSDVMYYQGPMSSDAPLTLRDQNSLMTSYCGQFPSRGRAIPSPGGPVKTVVIECLAE